MNITNNKKPGATFEKLPAVDTWIGVHLAARQWTYLDGSPVLYAKWADGEPNNWRGLNEECAVFSREWNDIECDNKRKYICGFPESEFFHVYRVLIKLCHYFMICHNNHGGYIECYLKSNIFW